uniref:Uncharacterized protein n=1 Tax=Triticum urartu TaxID=4572 RepID=A0A8R7PHH1_TRIUA
MRMKCLGLQDATRKLNAKENYGGSITCNTKSGGRIKIKDGDQIRKQFLVHLLNYINNEAAHNIPDTYVNSLALLGNTGIIVLALCT